MPFHSQRSLSVSAGDAAVLIRAMNRQRSDTPAGPSRPVASQGKVADLDSRVLSFVRRNSLGRDRATTSGSSVFPAGRRKASNQEKPATTAGSALPSSRRGSLEREKAVTTASGILPSSRRKPGSAVRAAERDQVEKGDRRVRRSAIRDDGPESRSNRTARATGSRSRSNRDERTPKASSPFNAVIGWFTDLTPRTRRGLTVAACALALIGFFYGPTADLYAASRDHTQLLAKVEATNAIADDLKAEVDRLQTEEGVMDEARIRGYANPGEMAADASDLLGIEDTVTVPELAKPIETEEPPLYIQALDLIMGYEEHV